MPDGRHVHGSLSLARAGLLVFERHIENPVRPSLDAPRIADDGEEPPA
ncbi:MAG: hypothetical protein ACREDJ_00550 [Methylocella sp.]